MKLPYKTEIYLCSKWDLCLIWGKSPRPIRTFCCFILYNPQFYFYGTISTEGYHVASWTWLCSIEPSTCTYQRLINESKRPTAEPKILLLWAKCCKLNLLAFNRGMDLPKVCKGWILKAELKILPWYKANLNLKFAYCTVESETVYHVSITKIDF